MLSKVNDQFRHEVCETGYSRLGVVALTPELRYSFYASINTIFRAVANFQFSEALNAMCPDHDQAIVTVPGLGPVFFSIEYRDRYLVCESAFPEDTRRTLRLLTIGKG